jgi:hypothetical protein
MQLQLQATEQPIEVFLATLDGAKRTVAAGRRGSQHIFHNDGCERESPPEVCSPSAISNSSIYE